MGMTLRSNKPCTRGAKRTRVEGDVRRRTQLPNGVSAHMIRTTPGDLIAVKHKRRYYYAVVLTRQIMLGGQLVFALYHSSKSLEDSEQVLKHGLKGFHCIIDFIFAQRAGSLRRISKVSIEKIDTVKYFRQDGPSYGLRGTWAIWDRDSNLVKTSDSLTEKEWRYPLDVCSRHESMCEQIDARWKPQDDKAKVASVAKGRVRINKHWSVTVPERMSRWNGPSEGIQIWRPRLTVTLSMWKKPGSAATSLKRIRQMANGRDIVAERASGETTLITYGRQYEAEDKPLRAFTCFGVNARDRSVAVVQVYFELVKDTAVAKGICASLTHRP